MNERKNTVIMRIGIIPPAIIAVVSLSIAIGVPILLKGDEHGPAIDVSQSTLDEADHSLVEEMTLGDPGAPVEVIEFASLTCPHCARFHIDAFGGIKSDYIDAGKVRFGHREVYFNRHNLWAGMMARCGGKERYFNIVDAIHRKQFAWNVRGDSVATVKNLRGIGREAGLSKEEMDSCMADNEHALALVATHKFDAERFGVRATPSFLIDGELHSNMPLDEFRKILDRKLTIPGGSH